MTPPTSKVREFSTYAEIAGTDLSTPPDWVLDHQPAGVDSHELDTARYTSPEFMAREAAELWPTVWQMACRENEIPEAGDYLEYTILDRSVLVVRDRDGDVQAFNNACRHRGTALAVGSGSTECFRCPFHGWTYALDGELMSLPLEWDFEHLDKATHGLRPRSHRVVRRLGLHQLRRVRPAARRVPG